MSKSFWVPYLTDNIYRLTGLGTHADITQLRQAVRKIESGMRVGITPKVPFADYMGDTELPNLPNILQQISSDTIKYICHKIMWFPIWETELATKHDPLDVYYRVVRSFEKGQPEHEHSAFLCELVRFVQTGNSDDLRKCIKKLNELYEHDKFRDYIDWMIEQDRLKPPIEKNQLIENIKYNIAISVLEYALSVATHCLSEGDFEQGKSILEVIVDSPLEDDWEDAVLSRIHEYVSPILSKIRETTERTKLWRFEYEDPHHHDSERINALVSLLRGRLPSVLEWEKVLQDWIDKRALLACGESIEKVGRLLEKARSTKYLGKAEKISLLNELRSLLTQVEHVIQTALQMKVSQRVRAYLLENLQAAREMLDQLPSASDVERSERSRSVSWLAIVGIALLMLCVFSSLATCAGSALMNEVQNSYYPNLPQGNPPSQPYFVPAQNSATTSDTTSELGTILEEADALYRSKKFSLAASTYRKAIRTARQYAATIPAQVYYKYGVCCEKSKQRSDAIWAYTTYIQNSSYGDKFREAVAALKRLGVVSRPKSGASPIGGGIRSGYSRIVLVNRSQRDAFVELLAFDYNQLTRVRDVYIRSGSQVTISKVPMGRYIIRVAYGELWDNKNKKFLINHSFSESDAFGVEERYTGYGVEYSIITFVLQESPKNNFGL